MIAVSPSRLHLDHHDLFQVIKHSLLLHRRRMLFSNSLPLNGQLIPLLDVFFDFRLNVLLIATRVHESLATSFDVVGLFVEALHFELNQLVFQLV
jgi:hypothetical protein